MAPLVWNSSSVQETITLGSALGQALRGNEVFAINGTLGTGKTHLVRGMAAGAGSSEGINVHSPTFVLVNEYEGRLTLYHIDAYRLDSAQQFEQLGFEDLLGPGSVVLIEWAERVEAALAGVPCTTVTLSHTGPTQRQIVFQDLPSYLVDALPGEA